MRTRVTPSGCNHKLFHLVFIRWRTAPSRMSLSSSKSASYLFGFFLSTLTIPLQVELGESIAARTESLCQCRCRPRFSNLLTTVVSSSILSRTRSSRSVSCCENDRTQRSTGCKSIHLVTLAQHLNDGHTYINRLDPIITSLV